MPKKLTTEEFIKRAKAVHGNRYNYDKTDYIRGSDKVIIGCDTHGDFLQKGQAHLQGDGCRDCGYLHQRKPNKHTKKSFIEKAKAIHGDFYIYDKVVYKTKEDKVVIICPVHGKFKQRAGGHLRGRGCKKCYHQRRSYTKKDFLDRANIKHGGAYGYSNIVFRGLRKKVDIECPVHGVFEQTPQNHLSGRGCPSCSASLQGWSYSSWQKAASKSLNFDSFKVYIIKCWNKKEQFYKIGKTYKTVFKRFWGNAIPYNYEIVETFVFDNAREYSEFEQELQNMHFEFKYTPKIEFGGMTECFSQLIEL